MEAEHARLIQAPARFPAQIIDTAAVSFTSSFILIDVLRSCKTALAYKLGKRVISQFIRTGCRRRLRLDLYGGVGDRRAADVPVKDSSRPGLALLTQQGKTYERAKFLELETIFPELVIRGALRDFVLDEDRVFDAISLGDCIDGLMPNQFALEDNSK